MAAKKSKGISSRQLSFTIPATETEAGVNWLNSLTEDIFRDKILAHLFRKMQKEGAVEWFDNIHGRNDKGVDYLVVSVSEFGRRIIGIQVKSKAITRSEGNGSLSSIRIQQECIAAMSHEFNVQKNPARLDNIELWCSAHVTEDAEKEFYAPGALIKVQLKKAPAILSLIEKYCPEILNDVPECALSSYVNEKRNPSSKKLKLLGCELNPKTNFLEPHFSAYSADSASNLKMENKVLRKRTKQFSFAEILFNRRHCVVLAPELSGKTYLLEHGEALVADSGAIPILLTKHALSEKPNNIYSFISRHLKFYTGKEVEALINSIQVVLLVDNLESVNPDFRDMLFAQDPNKIKVVGTARSLTAPPQVETYHMTGVNLGSITKFLRSLDVNLSHSKTFLDRAHAFIGRTLATSGLPSTPFTISIMLGECQNSIQRFSTPTMGRLIERFVEMQLGSHSDNTILVDFETKREFLTKLAGRNASSIRGKEFRREVIKFIESRSHPHSVDDFLADLRNSGVFTFTSEKIVWSHPVLKEYYWVKNLVSKGKLGPITKKLQSRFNVTLSALVGSQLKDATPVVDILVNDLRKIKLPSQEKVLKSVRQVGENFWDTEEQEEEFLATLEEGAADGNPHPIAVLAESSLAMGNDPAVLADEKPKIDLDDNLKAILRKKVEPLVTQLAESNLHIAFNLAAMLVNARDTKTEKKESTIKQIIAANTSLADWFHRFLEIVNPDTTKAAFDADVGRLMFLLQMTDRMVGDPFFVNVFKKGVAGAKTEDELLVLLDLVLCCGEEDYDFVLEKLKQIKGPEFRVAFYMRVSVLYFFRFHRDKDKKALKSLLRGIRRLEKAVELPHVK